MYLKLFICFLCINCSLQAQTNRALFVGINCYPPESGWMDIHGSNDFELVFPMLIKQGYSKRNIQVLLNEKATKDAIVRELKNIARQSKKGDHIYIQFSCHGQQMIDDNGDEPDGLDEAIIPYDALRKYVPGKYEGEKHLRDDELEALLENIRLKTGKTGNMIVVLDACHSGTGTRDGDEDEYVRGTSYIFAPEDYEYPEEDKEHLTLYLKKETYLSPISVFSACHADELNNEYRPTGQRSYYGSLTYAFCKLANTSFREILSNIYFAKKLDTEIKHMFEKRKRKQSPYFESTDEDNSFRIGR